MKKKRHDRLDKRVELNPDEITIPSREDILQCLTDKGSAMNRNDIFDAFGLEDEFQYEALRRRLRAMERDGQLAFTRQQAYVLAEPERNVIGEVIGHKDGFGWVRPQGVFSKEQDVGLPKHQMQGLLHGDTVEISVSENTKRGRKEGKVIRFIKAREGRLIGRFFVENNRGFVVPDDGRLHCDIPIEKDHRNSARMGNIVVVDLLPRTDTKDPIIGRIYEVLGEHLAPGMETEIAIRNHQIPNEWTEKVLEEAASYGEEVPAEALENRVDLRALPLITIDGEDARDFDDAVYCEPKKSGGWRLWVAIADVSYYVTPNSALDKEALIRGNSVYFPSQVVPMLPESLSNGLCSLNPNVDRLCMVCEMTVSKAGKLSSYKHYPAVMNSHARLTYTKVNQILSGDETLIERYQPLVGHITDLQQMYLALKNSRDARGAVEFETLETKFIFNAERKIERIEPVVRNDAHKIIEECMILANIASASYVEKNKEPALYRVHESPSEQRLQGFRDFLSELGLDLKGGSEPEPTDYADLAHRISGRVDKELIQTMLLRSMKQAIYHPDNQGHFGLALKRYAHFTSPIRRYPDLLLHRAIKYLLHKEGQLTDKAIGEFHYSPEQMDSFAEQCSMTERRADDATREVSDWLKCEYMQDHLGDTLDGVIANVTNFGLFVRLADYHIDGLVHVTSLDGDYYHFDMAKQRLIGERTRVTYRLGDSVKVRVRSVNLDERQIDFELVEPKRKFKPKNTLESRVDNAKRKAKAKKKGSNGFTIADPVKAKRSVKQQDNKTDNEHTEIVAPYPTTRKKSKSKTTNGSKTSSKPKAKSQTRKRKAKKKVASI